MRARRLGGMCSAFLVLVALVAMLGAVLARAAEPGPGVVRIGFVLPQSPSPTNRGVVAFWGRLRELGWIEGQNLVIEERWANGRIDRLPALIADVLGRKVDVLVTSGTPAAVAAKKATSTIPIVATSIGDPVRSGLAPSLGHPGGNLTGISLGWTEGMAGKWLELLQEAVPRLSTVAVIVNPDSPLVQGLAKDLEAVAPTRTLKVRIIEVREPGALDRAFEQARREAQGVLMLPAPAITAHPGQVPPLAAKYRLPTIYFMREFVDAGGLMSYSPDLAVMYRRAADYVDKILKGAKPADLPIEQPTQYQLVVNLMTAKALGLTIPESILLRADEVIR